MHLDALRKMTRSGHSLFEVGERRNPRMIHDRDSRLDEGPVMKLQDPKVEILIDIEMGIRKSTGCR